MSLESVTAAVTTTKVSLAGAGAGTVAAPPPPPKTQLYTWGHGGDGRLGTGARERVGVPESVKAYFPVPCPITIEQVYQISCGAEHCLALTDGGVWAWGQGAGGKLGLGDTKDRNRPTMLPQFRGRAIIQISAATWHSAAIVAIPPFAPGSGILYTWGSGYHGQLAQGTTQVALQPAICDYFMRRHLYVRYVACGSHHCAAIVQNGELYTWGSNKHGCLGHDIEERDVEHTPTPGHCGGFGAIVGRIGRGMPKLVACGREFTVVCTHPYAGPSLEVAVKVMEEQRRREEEERVMREEQQMAQAALNI